MKKWKITVTIFVLLVAAGAGTIYYFLNIKEYKTNDPKVVTIVKNDYKIKLPDDKTIQGTAGKQAEGNNSGSRTRGLAISKDKSGADNGTTQINTVSTAIGKQNTTVKPTEAAIIARYQLSFKNLENQADGKINTLMSYAFSEYQTKKANGEDISYFYFYSKYNGAAKKLEANTDASFNYIYGALVKDLENSGYSASAAQPLKDQYMSLKKERRSALLNKAMAHF